MPLLSVRNLKVYFKIRQGWVRAVDGVGLEVDQGETVGLVGESGCGKTTLAYAISQLLPSNAHVLGGQVFFNSDRRVDRYRQSYRRTAEERMAKDLAEAEAELARNPTREEDDRSRRTHDALDERVQELRYPLSATYRRYLKAELKPLKENLDRIEARAAQGDKAARDALREAQARYAAASQEFDLVDITRRSDGRLREYHPKLNEIRWKEIAMVFQGAMNALNPVYTVGDQIIEAIQAHEEVDEEQGQKRVVELYKLVGIPVDRIDNFPHEYSGGMKQRAMIAMALALNPKLVIMDEPTTALDVITAAKIMDEVLRIQRQLKMTLIIISHDVSTVAKVADRICVMYAGQIVEESVSKEIFDRTLHPYTDGLLGAFPSVKGEKRRLEAIPGSPPSLVTPPSGCRFHPRCKYAKDICTTTDPPYFVLQEPPHRSLCHFSNEFSGQGGLARA